MKRTLHKALSMLLTAAMVLNMGLTPVFAAEGTPPGISGVCNHHTEHTADCGYKQGMSCNHEHAEDCSTRELTCDLVEGDTAEAATDGEATLDSGEVLEQAEVHTHGEDCYTQTDNCTHTHDEVCGYTPDSPCSFDPASCTECKPSNQPIEKVCTCEPTIGASDTGHGKDCPLYTAPALSEAVKALIAMVDALPNAADITEDNKEATLTDFEAAAMAYGELSDDDKAAFEETAQYTKLMALHTALYPIALMVNEAEWDISGGNLTLTSACGDACGGHTVNGDTTTYKIIVQSGTHNVTLDNVTIDVSSTANACAFEITGGATVNLTLTGANTLKSGNNKAGLQVGTGNTLTITAESTGSLSATGGQFSAGIGGGKNGAGGTITISGGTVDAIGNIGGAGIGGGSSGTGGDITISGGTVNATGSSGGAGIGGNGFAGDTITINGGTVTAKGGGGGAGIGGGYLGAGGIVTIQHNAVVFAVRGNNTNDIGAGNGGTGGTVNKNGGIIFEVNDGKVYGCTLEKDLTVNGRQTLEIVAGKTLTVPSGITLHSTGTLKMFGTVTGAGKYTGNGSVMLGNSMINPPENLVYTGTAKEISVTLLDHVFEKGANYTVKYTNNTEAGEATATVTTNGQLLIGSANKTFTITQSDTAFTGGITVDKSDKSYTYGDTITVEVTPTATGTAPAPKGRAVPTANQMALFKGTVQLTAPKTVTSGSKLTFSIATKDKQLAIGENIITAKYVESTSMAGHEQTITVTLNPKPLTAKIDTKSSRTYDGTTAFTANLSPQNAVLNDLLTITSAGTTTSADVGTPAFTPATVTLGGKDAGWYRLAVEGIAATPNTVIISPATPSVSVTAAKKEKSHLRTVIGDHNDIIVLTAATKGKNDEKPNGEVVFKHGETLIGTASTKNGEATCDWANPPAGNITVTAQFTASDSETNYSQTTVTGTYDFAIDKVEQAALAITPVTGKTYGDAPFTLATTGGSGTGAVTYVSGNASVLTISGDTATIVGAGDATITATKAGDGNYNDVTSAEATITVNPTTPTLSWGANVTQTTPYTGNAVVIPNAPTAVGVSGGTTPNGTITYQHKSTVTTFTNLFGLLEGYTNGLPANVGEYKIVATMAANGNYGETQSNEMTLTIEKSNPMLTINSYAASYTGKAVEKPLEANMTITGAVYENVTFAYSEKNDMSNPLSAAPKEAGTYYVQASVEASDNTNAATSTAVSFTIAKINPTITVTTDKSSELGGKQVVVTVKITNPADATNGFPEASEIAIAPTNATILGAIEGADGTYAATYTLGAYSEGAKAKFVATVPNETTNYNANTTVTTSDEVEILDKYTPTITLAASSSQITYGESVTLTATVGKNGQTSPLAGTVQFELDNANLDVPVAINADGVATLTVGKEALTFNNGASHNCGAAFTPATGSDYKWSETSTNTLVQVIKAEMDGKVTITGTPKYGETLTANTSDLAGQAGDALGQFQYMWFYGKNQPLGIAATYTIQEKDIGNAIFVKVTPGNGDYKPKESTKSVMVTKADSTVNITGNLTKIYDGTAVSNPTTSQTGSTGAVTFEWYSGGVKLDSTPKNAGSYTVKAILAASNTHVGAEATKDFTITAKATTPTIEPITAVTYDGTAKEPALTVKDGSTTLTAGTDYTAVYSDNTNAGVNTGKVAVTLKGNYSGRANATFTIDKASGLTATTPNNILMIKGQEKAYTFDLSTIALSKTDAGTITYALGVLTNDNSIFKAIPSINGTEMTFTSNSIATPAANQATQVVTISTQNYADTTVTLTFDITDKTPVTITGLTAATSLVYNGSAQKGYTGTAVFDPEWSGTLTYTYYEGTGTGGTELSGAPTNAGTYTVVAAIPDSDTTFEGSHAPITFTIGAKALTVSDGTLAITKVYDKTNTFTASTGSLGLTGVVGTGAVSVKIDSYGAAADANVGTKTISLGISLDGTDKGNYTVTSPYSFTNASITAKTTTPTIDAITAVTYDGTEHEPALTVKGDGKTLVSGTDYDVTYSDNINAGVNTGRVAVTLKGNYSGSASANFTINKAAGSAISGDVTGSYTGNGTNFTYTVVSISGAEYKMDSGAWQDSNIFTGILPLSRHTFSARMKADANHLAGAEKAGIEVEFVKLSGVAAPTLAYTVSREGSNKTITITTTVTGAEYQFGSDAWSDTKAKTYSTDETVIIGIRMKTTLTHEAGTAATASVNLAKQEQEAPATFTLTYAANGETDYTVTIPEVTGCEYSFDGTSYNSTRTKTANVGDTVTGYMRKAETTTHNASPAVRASITLPMFKVQPVTADPNGGSFTGSVTVTLASSTTGAEIYYTKDGM